MDTLDMPVVAASLFRTRGFPGPSLAQQNVKAQLMDLWQAKRCVQWRAALGRVLTTVARLCQSGTRDALLKTLRSCGRSYRANVQCTWKPFVVVCLGLCAVPLEQLEQLMGRSFRRLCPAIAAVASKAMEVPVSEPAGAAEPAQDCTGSASSSSSSDSSDSSASSFDDSCSSDEHVDQDEADDSFPCSSRVDNQASSSTAAHAPAGMAPSSSSIPLQAGSVDSNVTSKQNGEVARILHLRNAVPRRLLDLPARGPVEESEIRKKYLKLAALVHPDKCSLPEATQAFQIVHSAYEQLRR